MAAFRCLFFASVAAVGDALQQPASVGRETDGAFRAVSSKMDEFHAGLAKVKSDSLNAVSKRKAELDLKLQELLERNRNAENANGVLASDIMNLQKKNTDLRNTSSELTHECQHITEELRAMQLNITMAQEFIARAINSSNFSLHSSPALQILTELDDKDATAEREQRHEKHLKDLGALFQVGVAEQHATETEEKSPGTQDLLDELLSSWNAMSGQQSTSLISLEGAFAKEQGKSDQDYATLLQEQTQLNATKQAEEALNVKLQSAVAHLEGSREHLVQEKVAVQRFAKRLENKPIQGADALPPPKLSLPQTSDEEAASTPEELPSSQVLLEDHPTSWLKSILR